MSDLLPEIAALIDALGENEVQPGATRFAQERALCEETLLQYPRLQVEARDGRISFMPEHKGVVWAGLGIELVIHDHPALLDLNPNGFICDGALFLPVQQISRRMHKGDSGDLGYWLSKGVVDAAALMLGAPQLYEWQDIPRAHVEAVLNPHEQAQFLANLPSREQMHHMFALAFTTPAVFSDTWLKTIYEKALPQAPTQPLDYALHARLALFEPLFDASRWEKLIQASLSPTQKAQEVASWLEPLPSYTRTSARMLANAVAQLLHETPRWSQGDNAAFLAALQAARWGVVFENAFDEAVGPLSSFDDKHKEDRHKSLLLASDLSYALGQNAQFEEIHAVKVIELATLWHRHGKPVQPLLDALAQCAPLLKEVRPYLVLKAAELAPPLVPALLPHMKEKYSSFDLLGSTMLGMRNWIRHHQPTRAVEEYASIFQACGYPFEGADRTRASGMLGSLVRDLRWYPEIAARVLNHLLPQNPEDIPATAARIGKAFDEDEAEGLFEALLAQAPSPIITELFNSIEEQAIPAIARIARKQRAQACALSLDETSPAPRALPSLRRM